MWLRKVWRQVIPAPDPLPRRIGNSFQLVWFKYSEFTEDTICHQCLMTVHRILEMPSQRVCGLEPVQLLDVALFVPNFNHDKEVKVRIIVKAHALIPYGS